MIVRASSRAVGIVALAVLVSSCGSGTQTTVVEDPVATTLVIAPSIVAFSFLTESRALQADIRDQNGSPFAATTTWSTSDAAVVSIDATGIATAVANGTATITATAAGLTATLTIEVQQVPRILVAQQGDDQDAVAGTALPDTIVMRLTDLAGSPVEGVEVVFEPDSTAGTVSVDTVVTGADGLAATVWTLGSDYGPQSLFVTSGDLEATLESFSRSATPIADLLFESALSLSRSDPSTLDSLVVTATVRNQGDLATGATFRVEARAGGSQVAFADYPLLAPDEETQVQLQLPPLAAGAQTIELVLDPDAQLAELIESNNTSSRSIQVFAQASMTTGVPVPGLSASLGQELLFVLEIPPGSDDALNISISDASVGPNDDLDLFVAQGRRPSFREDYPDCVSAGPSTEESCQIVFPEGTYHILLHAWEDPDGVAVRTGFTDVTLTATLGNTIVPFDIEIVILDNGTPTQDQAFLDAAARWETIIRGDIPNQDFSGNSIPAGACFENQPSISDEIDDLRIYVQIQPIDEAGGTLGQAGPCLPGRPITGLPFLGLMTFDEADVAVMEAQGTLLDVVLHEMGHVLGIGTLWSGLLQAPSLPNNPGADTHFRGDGAIEAFDAAGGVGYSGAKVPVENMAGPGSGDAHWRESVFNTELMTPFIEQAPTANPLSAVTIRALEDVGYGVDVSMADGYVLPVLPALRVAPPTSRLIDLRGDVWIGRRIDLDPKSRVMEIRR